MALSLCSLRHQIYLLQKKYVIYISRRLPLIDVLFVLLQRKPNNPPGSKKSNASKNGGSEEKSKSKAEETVSSDLAAATDGLKLEEQPKVD